MALVIDAGRRRGARPTAAWLLAARVVLLAFAGAICLTAPAVAATRTKLVRYDGYSVSVPSSWPVFNLAGNPTACVRFNRHAVYLGDPGASQRCPTHAAGRTEAILIEPAAAAPTALPAGGAMERFTPRGRQVVVTATWGEHPASLSRALGRQVDAAATSGPRASAARAGGPVGHAAVAGTTFTGYGFDSCSAPSASALAAWHGTSPFQAVGVYIGGANSSCAQPNLSASWVAQVTAGGWDLIPTYVGLQAPGACSGCNSISSSKAAAEGTAAAENAVADAQALGLGSGTPIYDDMEAYATTSKNTSMVRTFLAAWTTELHTLGYVSGVYSSSDSGITNLAAVYGTAYVEPDDLWIANWNNTASTADPKVPTADWAADQRVHQYRGGHSDDYGHASIEIDTDYVDARVAGTIGGTTTAPTLAPVASVAPGPDGSISIHAIWAGHTGITSWQLLVGNSSTSLAPFGAKSLGGQHRVITIRSQYAYFQVQALSAAGTPLGSSETIATPPHMAIYGHSVFVPPHGLAGVPVGCFVPTGCAITTTITAGHTLIGKTGADPIGSMAGGIEYFMPTPAGRKLLASAPGRRLAVTVTSTDSASGSTGGVGSGSTGETASPVSATLDLIPYTTSGASPAKTLTDGPSLRILSATAYAYRDSVGGILVDCASVTPCMTSLELWHGHTTLAQTGAQWLGAGELGYLSFKLTPAGHSMLASNKGNQVSSHVYVSDGTTSSSGQIAVVGYH